MVLADQKTDCENNTTAMFVQRTIIKGQAAKIYTVNIF